MSTLGCAGDATSGEPQAVNVGHATVKPAFFQACSVTGDAQWVTNVYLYYLQRQPSQSEVGQWVAAMSAGMPRSQVISEIINSAEGQTKTAQFANWVAAYYPSDPVGGLFAGIDGSYQAPGTMRRVASGADAGYDNNLPRGVQVATQTAIYYIVMDPCFEDY
jgi:hypothetical protein